MQATTPAPLLIEKAVVTPIVQHIERSLENQSPWKSAFTQLSWMPYTTFGNREGLGSFMRVSLKAIDWLIFSAGLVIGIGLSPTIYPIVCCVSAYDAVTDLRHGIADLQSASELLQTAQALPAINATIAQDVLQIYRGQACHPRVFSVEHRSSWSSLAEAELLKYFDSKIPGFSLQMRAQDARENRKALLFKSIATQGLLLANQNRSIEETRMVQSTDGKQVEIRERREDVWNQFIRQTSLAVLASV